MVYLLMFGVTALLGWLVQQRPFRYDKGLRFLLSILIVLIPSILGGMRSRYLGTDNIVYARQFEQAVASSARAIMEGFGGSNELMPRVLRLAISRLTRDYHWYFFAIELITMGFAYAGMYHFRDKVPLWLSLTVYMFCFYCLRIHLVWQGVATAIIFYAFRYVVEERPVKYFLLTVLAFLFHSSALLGLLIYLVYYCLSLPDKRNPLIRMDPARLILVMIIAVIAVPAVASVLIKLKVLPKVYSDYIPGITRLDPEESITRLPLLLVATLLYRDVEQRDPLFRFLYVMLWAEFLTAQLGSGNSHAWRISLYFAYFNMLTIPYLLKVVRNDRTDKGIGYALVLLYLGVFWVFWFVLNNRGFKYPVYPFITDLL